MLQQWMTSMTSFASIIFPILQTVSPKRIGEVGAAEGGNTQLLYDFIKQQDGKLITIDPFPRGTFLEWVRTCQDHVTHIPRQSLEAIPEAGPVDVWFVDGDHNWYTVYHELQQIQNLANQHAKPLLVFLHDVSWPCGRRDMYYDPARVPEAFRQPYESNEAGITLERPFPMKQFLKGPYWASKEGGERNGVLTAVEDFFKTQQRQYYWIHIPAMLGLGMIIDVLHPDAQKIVNFYAAMHQNPLIQLMEDDRLRHYIASTAMHERIKALENELAQTKLTIVS